MVDAAIHVRVEDAPCMCAVVSVVERSECPDHQVRDKLEVVRLCGAYDDVAS